MDLAGTTFIGLITIGLVNVLSFFFPKMDSKVKFGVSVVFAFALTFVPADIGSVILDKLKIALEVSFSASGVYKIAQKIGGESI